MTSENPKLFVAWADDLDTHVNDKNNPHGVTAEQLGAATVEEVEEVKKSVSDGKTLVANAITAKGIDTAADATFATMAENIEEIVTLENGTEDATATAEQILLDMKAYVKGLPVIGTMPNNGAVSGALNCGGSYKIPKGYHDGNGVITANSLASQTVGTATAAQILSGKTAWANGEKITGTIQSQAAQTITPGTANKTIAAGKYLSGVQTIKGDSNLKAANIKKGVSIFGVAGSCDSFADSLNCVHENIVMTNTTERTLSTTSKIRLIVISSQAYTGVRGSLYIFPQSSCWMIMTPTGLIYDTASFIGNRLYSSTVGYSGNKPTIFTTSIPSTYYQYIHVANDLLSATFYIEASSSSVADQLISIFT